MKKLQLWMYAAILTHYGTLTEERINQSVRRILKLKKQGLE